MLLLQHCASPFPFLIKPAQFIFGHKSSTPPTATIFHDCINTRSIIDWSDLTSNKSEQVAVMGLSLLKQNKENWKMNWINSFRPLVTGYYSMQKKMYLQNNKHRMNYNWLYKRQKAVVLSRTHEIIFLGH